jgi:excisionase family DNA binding protein
MTKAEAAEYARVHPDTIDRWRQEGLVFSMVRGKVLIAREDLDAYIRSHRARTIARRHRLTA